MLRQQTFEAACYRDTSRFAVGLDSLGDAASVFITLRRDDQTLSQRKHPLKRILTAEREQHILKRIGIAIAATPARIATSTHSKEHPPCPQGNLVSHRSPC